MLFPWIRLIDSRRLGTSNVGDISLIELALVQIQRGTVRQVITTLVKFVTRGTDGRRLIGTQVTSTLIR